MSWVKLHKVVQKLTAIEVKADGQLDGWTYRWTDGRMDRRTDVQMAGWDNDGEPGNQVPTKSSYSTEIFGRSPAFWQNMYRYEYNWAEKDQINNFLSYYWHFWWVESIKMVLKVHNSRLLGRNICKRPRVPTKITLLSHPGSRSKSWLVLTNRQGSTGTQSNTGIRR